MKAMIQAAEDDEAIAARVKLFLHRTPEELYDYQRDPDALHNLTGDKNQQDELNRLRRKLLVNMRATNDPLADAFQESWSD